MGQGRAWVLSGREEGEEIVLGPADSLIFIAVGEDRDGGVKELSLYGKAVATAMNYHGGSSWSPACEFRFADSIGADITQGAGVTAAPL